MGYDQFTGDYMAARRSRALGLPQISRRTRGLRKFGLNFALVVFMAAPIGSTGCTPVGNKAALDDMAKSIKAADPGLTVSYVEKGGMDGFGHVLAVGVAIREPAISTARLRNILSAVTTSPGASGFDDLSLSVTSPDADGDLVDLEASVKELGLTAVTKPVSSIQETMISVRQALKRHPASNGG